MFARLAELSRERARSERVEALELTPREMEILQLIAEGLSNRSIAERLSLSVYTVKNHVHHILEKLHVQDRREAVEHAYARHWLRPQRVAVHYRRRCTEDWLLLDPFWIPWVHCDTKSPSGTTKGVG